MTISPNSHLDVTKVNIMDVKVDITSDQNVKPGETINIPIIEVQKDGKFTYKPDTPITSRLKYKINLLTGKKLINLNLIRQDC